MLDNIGAAHGRLPDEDEPPRLAACRKQNYRKIMDYGDLWILKARLDEPPSARPCARR